MTQMPKTAQSIKRVGAFTGDTISLTYEARLMRRKRLVSDQGTTFLVDLPNVVNLLDGDAFEFEDGSLIGVRAADEILVEIRGDLVRLAWHIGNRHTPCQIEDDYILIAHDHVIADMLRGLGATVVETTRPFSPEGGAYGTGRTFGHSRSHD